jgi:hypothetical protein
MSTPTLPLAAVDLFDDGHPWFPFRTSADTGAITLFAYSPRLRDAAWRWVDAPASGPHASVALDAAHVAQLIFLAPIAPEDVDPAGLPELLESLLIRWHCNPAALLDTIAAEFGAWPEQSASQMQRCIAAASQLLGVAP